MRNRSHEWRQQVAIGLIMLVVGVVCVRLALTGEYASLVKKSMRPWLWLAGATVTGMAVWTLLQQRRDRGAGVVVHGGIATVGALLLIPMLVLLTVPTPSSGVYLAGRSRGAAAPAAGATDLGPLPEGDVVGIRVDDYVIRTVFKEPSPMVGRSFRVIGFVANVPGEQQWYLTRMKVSCCVADALSYRVRAVGAQPLADNTWVEVTGEYLSAVDRVAQIKVASVRPVPVPEQPLLS